MTCSRIKEFEKKIIEFNTDKNFPEAEWMKLNEHMKECEECFEIFDSYAEFFDVVDKTDIKTLAAMEGDKVDALLKNAEIYMEEGAMEEVKRCLVEAIKEKFSSIKSKDMLADMMDINFKMKMRFEPRSDNSLPERGVAKPIGPSLPEDKELNAEEIINNFQKVIDGISDQSLPAMFTFLKNKIADVRQ